MSTLLLEPAEARAPPATAAQAILERDYLSFSAVRLYQQCPLRFMFRYRMGLPEETVGASLVFGSAIHRAVEHHFRRLLEGQTAPSTEELLAEYKEGFKDHSVPIRFGKDEDASSLNSLAEKMLTAFSTSDVARPTGRILAVEETLRGQIVPGLPDLLGRVDLIVEEQEELVICDWKTSRARYSQDQVEDSTEQLLLYSELAKDFSPGKRVRLEFAILTKTKETVIERHKSQPDSIRVDRIKRIVERVWRSIEAEHFYPAPSTMNCPGCPYKDACRKWPA
jgi:CRISPR/Cas system-associated exonuclease Cas4 (RecB family)